MRRNLLVAVLVGTGMCFTMWCTAMAQQGQGQPARASGAGVAIVDVAYVFKNYTKFNNLHEQLKKDIKIREDEITKLQTDIKGLITQRSQHNPDSPTSKDLDSKIAQKKAELEVLNESSRREFTQHEARIYHQTYQEIEAQIKRYAQTNGIILVLRAAKDDGDNGSSNPQEVVREMSQQVIYALPGLDITDIILESLNGRPKGDTKTKQIAPNNNAPTEKPRIGSKVDSDKETIKKPAGGTIKK